MLRLFRNHSAFNSHNFPRTYTTTYPCSVCRYSLATKPPHHVGPLDSEITPFLPVVLTGWLPSLSTPSALRSLSMPFQLRALHDPLRDYSPPILPLCIQYIQPTYRDCTLHVPRRLWMVRDSNPRAISDSRVSGAVLSASQPTFLWSLAFDSIAITSCRHTSRPLCFAQSGTWGMPTACLVSHHSGVSPSLVFWVGRRRTSPTNLL